MESLDHFYLLKGNSTSFGKDLLLSWIGPVLHFFLSILDFFLYIEDNNP